MSNKEVIYETGFSSLVDELETISIVNTVLIRYSIARKEYDVSCGNLTSYSSTVSGAIRGFLKLYKAVSKGETKNLVVEEKSK